MAQLTIFQTKSTNEIPDIQKQLDKLRTITKLSIKNEDVPAVVGELAGEAINILLSIEVQLPLTLIAIGQSSTSGKAGGLK